MSSTQADSADAHYQSPKTVDLAEWQSTSLDTSDWWTAIQVNSALVSCDAYSLQNIFSRLDVTDACHAGLTCRRLYSQWLESRKTAIAVELIGEDERNTLKEQKAFFLRNTDSDLDQACDGDYLPKLVAFKLPQDSASLEDITQHFVAAYVNLRYLEVSMRLEPADFGPLLTQLTASSLAQLVTLKLYAHFLSWTAWPCPKPLNYFWRPFAALQHPTLKHLTLSIFSENVRGFALKSSPQLPILQQLSSFTFFIDLPVIYEMVHRLILDSPFGVHLTPGVGARFAMRLKWPQSQSLSLTLMPFITYLELTIDSNHNESNPMVDFCLAVSHMRNLQKLDLKINKYSDRPNEYPSFLSILSSLAHLQELSIDCHRDQAFGSGDVFWPLSSQAVFPSVRVLSLKYSTPNHTNIVADQLQLTHCFPSLRLLQCHFWQQRCEHCHYKEDSYPDFSTFLPQCQACGLALAQGFTRVHPETELKVEMQFTFNRFNFNSLENLLAGIKD